MVTHYPMNLEQWNTDLDARFKKKIRLEAAELGCPHYVLSNAMAEFFFRSFPKKNERRAQFEAMKKKFDEGGDIDFSPLQTVVEPAKDPVTLDHVELADAGGH